MADIADDITTNAVLETSLSGRTGTFSGQIETVGDHDWIRVTLIENSTYDFYLALQNVGSAGGDSEITLRDANGNFINRNDDNGVSLNSFLEFTPTTGGTYYLDVFDHNDDDRGAYSLLMTNLTATDVFKDDDTNTVTGDADQRIAGGAGDDSIDIGAGFDALGEQGSDTLVGNSRENLLSGGLGNDFVQGGAGNDFIFGDAGDDFLAGGSDSDELFGGNGLDDLDGGAGQDRLSGGAGTDFLTGGTDSDVFVFRSVTDSTPGPTRDVILDFDRDTDHDRIGLAAIDANTHAGGDQAFKFIGSHGFHHHAGELRYSGHVLQADVNGDGRADFEVQVNAQHLLASDFML